MTDEQRKPHTQCLLYRFW